MRQETFGPPCTDNSTHSIVMGKRLRPCGVDLSREKGFGKQPVLKIYIYKRLCVHTACVDGYAQLSRGVSWEGSQGNLKVADGWNSVCVL